MKKTILHLKSLNLSNFSTFSHRPSEDLKICVSSLKKSYSDRTSIQFINAAFNSLLFRPRNSFTGLAKLFLLNIQCSNNPKLTLSKLTVIKRKDCRHKNLTGHALYSYLFQKFRTAQ